MKKLIPFVFIFFLATLAIFAQDQRVKIYDPPLAYSGNAEWGTDYLVADSEPFGRPSGVYRNVNSTIYVSIPDTNISLPGADEGLVILTSTNNGANWIQGIGISPAVVIQKSKMISAGPDSIYCFYQVGGSVYSLNVINGNLNLFTNYTNIRDFDVTSSSTGSLYLIIDLYTSNEVRIFGSANGGSTWGGAIFLSSNAARPTITMSATGDTAVINYYGGPFTDTVSSIIRNVRYRESVPGTLLIAGTFTTPIQAGIPKDQFQAVRYGQKAWLFYTTRIIGNVGINCIYSSDGGTTYGTAFTIGFMPGRDDYWFDSKYYTLGSGGVSLIYYSDSLQTGPPTNNSDYMNYISAPNTNPTTFITPMRFSEHPPVSSTRGYIPTLIEYYNTVGDAGAIWVGADGANIGIYFDRLQTATGVTQQETGIPQMYSLGQNYPNPFNPKTIINYEIPSNVNGQMSNVKLVVYNALGKEVAILVNENQNAGSYSVEWNGTNYSSGIYFYKITTENFSEIKKMTLLK